MKRFLILLIRFYQRFLSGLKRRGCCRFYPTCSCYAVTAIETHGALKGSLLSLWRILRCQPFCKGGYDPVPFPKNPKRKNNHMKMDGGS